MMWRRSLMSLVVFSATQITLGAEESILVYGSNRTKTSTVRGLTTYLAPAFEIGPPVACARTDGRTGQWAARVASAGVYTAAIEEAYGFGPAIRPGIVVRRDGFNRVTVALPFEYDLLAVERRFSEKAHKEFGQTFVATGTNVVGIVFPDAAGVLVSMHEKGPGGRQVGQTVTASTFYPPGTLPTVPGSVYYLRFVRRDGTPFRMWVVPKNRYRKGAAFLDGKKRDSVDLALRMQRTPTGQIVRCKPRRTEVLRQVHKTYGQSFVAKGTSLAMLSVFPSGYPDGCPKLRLRIYESGPGGKPITPAMGTRVLVLGPGQLALAAGKRYYVEVTSCDPKGGLRMWVSRDDELPQGELYLDGRPVPHRDLAMILVEYDRDTTAPPPPRPPSWRPGMSSYAQRFVADGKIRLVWDIPGNNDIAGVVVRRIEPGKRQQDGSEGTTVLRMPVSASGRYQYVDAGLTNGVRYSYRIRTVDVAGNESAPLIAPAIPTPGLPMAAHLLNPDFTDLEDSQLPYGWMIQTIHGTVPALRTAFSHRRGDALPAAGWEVLQEGDSSDSVLYQRVPCQKGRWYRVVADVYQWNPWNNRSMVIGAAVGLDPAGGDNPLAQSVVWSPPTFRRETWIRLSATAVAKDDYMTVFLRGFAAFSRLMNVRFRNIELIDVTHQE